MKNLTMFMVVLQDNGSWVGPSEGIGGISNSDWQSVGYGDGFNVMPDPTDKNILYWQYQGGNLMRFHKNTREIKEVKPFTDNPDEKLRFNWDTPIAFSPTQTWSDVCWFTISYIEHQTEVIPGKKFLLT